MTPVNKVQVLLRGKSCPLTYIVHGSTRVSKFVRIETGYYAGRYGVVVSEESDFNGPLREAKTVNSAEIPPAVLESLLSSLRLYKTTLKVVIDCAAPGLQEQLGQLEAKVDDLAKTVGDRLDALEKPGEPVTYHLAACDGRTVTVLSPVASDPDREWLVEWRSERYPRWQRRWRGDRHATPVNALADEINPHLRSIGPEFEAAEYRIVPA